MMTTSSRSGTIAGRVVDLDGNPIGNARIHTSAHEDMASFEQSASVDRHGRFAVDADRTLYGTTLWIDSPDHARVRYENVVVFPGRSNDLGDIALPNGARVSGRVITAEGAPICNATVRLSPSVKVAPRSGGPNGPPWVLPTDDEGRFDAPPIPAGDLNVRASAPGKGCVEVLGYRVPLADRSIRIEDIVLPEADEARGVVVDEDEKPITGARVFVESEGPHATTDADGTFRLTGRTPKAHYGEADDPPRPRLISFFSFHATHPDHHDARLVVGPHEVEHMPFRIRMQRKRALNGTVRDATTGAPIPFDHVLVQHVLRSKETEQTWRRDVDRSEPRSEPGRFGIAPPRHGEYALVARAEGYRDAETVVVIADDTIDVDEVVIEMTRGTGPVPKPNHYAMEGVVVNDGAPIGGASVMALSPSSGSGYDELRGQAVEGASHPLRSTIADAAGRFHLPQIPRGGCVLRIDEPGTNPFFSDVLPVEGDTTTRIDVAASGVVTGRVHPPRTERGLAWIVAFDRTALRTQVRVAPDGSFRLDRLPLRPVYLKVGHDTKRDPLVCEGRPPRWPKDRTKPFFANPPVDDATVGALHVLPTREGIDVSLDYHPEPHAARTRPDA